MAADGPWAALLPVLDALDGLAVPWHVGGSLASGLHGVFRSTNDVDVIAALRRDHAAPLAVALMPSHVVAEEWIADAIRRGASFNAIHEASGFKVDVFVQGHSALDLAMMARRVALPLPGTTRTIHVKSAEDIILQKLRWYRDEGEVSQQQWRDVLGVLRLQSDALDDPYLDEWAVAEGLASLLARARSEAR